MKHPFSLSLILSASMIVGGCASHKDKAITASPAPIVANPDAGNSVDINVDFNIPSHYFSSRSRLFITPAYMEGDSIIKEYEPIVLDAPIFGKKTLRKEVLHGYVDPYAAVATRVSHPSRAFSVHYEKTLRLPDGADGGRIVAVTSADGCGQCTGMDTIDVALLTVPSDLMRRTFRTSGITPEFKVTEKIHHGNGEARLQFIVDKWDIVPDLADNRAELRKMKETLGPILADTLATVTSLNIFGSASAEASYAHNVMLAKSRANSAKNWLGSQLDLPASVRNIIKVGAKPEGWEPVVQAMIAANDPDSSKVRELMIKYPGPTDDAAEKYIRRLPCWPRIRSNYLAKDRKVIYDYTWTIRNFTDDAEMIRVWQTRPDALSEDEFLRVATLAKDDSSRTLIYESMLGFFPDSPIALNNLALLYLEAGYPDKAAGLLEKIGNPSEAMEMNLAVALAASGEEERAAELLSGIDSADARYNLALLKAAGRDMAGAYELLEGTPDINAAIAAIGCGKMPEADEIILLLDDSTPLAEYVRAIIASRKGADADCIRHLRNAAADPALRKRAANEPDFLKYKENPDFTQIFKK